MADSDTRLQTLPAAHPFRHHARVFVNMIDLVVRNSADLESQVKVALFTYGQRHYTKHHVDFANVYLNTFSRSIISMSDYCE